jgi:hypothetical protein
MSEVILVILGGITGSLIKEILDDNCLQLPSLAKGKINLGFLGSIAIGAFVGYAIDGGFISACFAGYSGISIITNLMPKTQQQNPATKTGIETIIRAVCQEEQVDPELALKVAQCESGLDPQAINTNTDGSRDRGLFQINEKYHPEVTESEAFSVVSATRFFCRAFKSGNLSWWNASRTCWDKK